MTSRMGPSSGAVRLAVGDDGALWLRRRNAGCRPSRGAQLGDEAILAAFRGGCRGGTECDLLFFPSRVECGQVIGVLIGFANQCSEHLRLRLGTSQRLG